MPLIKSTFKRFDGTAWQVHYFRTSADIIDETTNFKILTGTERGLIDEYLYAFNDSNLLLKLDSAGLIPEALIPGGLDYLTINNPTFTGTLTGSATGKAVLPGGIEFTANSTITNPFDEAIRFTMGQEILTLNDQGFDFNNSLRIVGLLSPTQANEAATKGYVDALAAEGARPVAPVQAATTANITLSGLQTIDGIAVEPGDRVLVKNQTTATQNGIYNVSTVAWAKDTADSAKGALVFVEEGTVNNDSKFYASTDTNWILFSRTDTYGVIANGGLQKVGTDFGVETGGITNAMLAGSIEWSKLLNTAASDVFGNTQWSNLGPAATATSLVNHISQLYTAIKMARGTALYNTSNAQSIAGAYTLANTKNRTYVGSSDPATTGFEEGDLFFQDLL